MANAPASTNRILLALCLSSFLAALNFLATTPFYPEMSDELNVSVSALGQIITFMVLLSALLGLAIGPIADRYGYHRPLVIGVLCVAVNLTGSGLAPSFPFIIALSPIGGLADALVFGIPLAIAGTRFDGNERKRAISWIVGALSCGGIIGVPLLTVVGSVTSWRVALMASGIVSAGVALFVSRTLPVDRRTTGGRWNLGLFRRAYSPLAQHPPTVRLLVASAIRAACWLGFLTYLGAFLDEEIGLSTRQIGLVYTVGGTGYAAGSVVAGRLLDLAPARWMVAAMSVVSGLATAAAVSISTAPFVVGTIVVLATASAIASIGVVYLLSTESPAESATTMVLNSSMVNFGTAGGAAIGGALVAIGGYPMLGVGLSFFALLGAALVLWPLPWRRAGSDVPADLAKSSASSVVALPLLVADALPNLDVADPFAPTAEDATR